MKATIGTILTAKVHQLYFVFACGLLVTVLVSAKVQTDNLLTQADETMAALQTPMPELASHPGSAPVASHIAP